jgi:hypothetical protein
MPDDSIDQLMTEASAKLVATDYLACEALCQQALGLARKAEDFETYARALMPLQEARRQRRQIAADGPMTVLTAPRMTPVQILEAHSTGCIMLIDPPYSDEDEQAVREQARSRGLFIEVLRMDHERLRQCFEDQAEREGDAALAALDPKAPTLVKLDALAQQLDRLGDHEIAHQRLAALARQAAKEKATASHESQ